MANKYQQHSKVNRKKLYARIHNRGGHNCIRKVAFDNKEDAIKFIKKRGYDHLRPYQCRNCHKWHNSTKSVNTQKNSRRIKSE